MKYNVVIIRGTHNGHRAVVTFTHIGRKVWCARLECGGKVIEVNNKKPGLRPCPTHAGDLLDRHFPSERRKAARALERDAVPEVGQPQHQGLRVFSSLTPTPNGEA